MNRKANNLSDWESLERRLRIIYFVSCSRSEWERRRHCVERTSACERTDTHTQRERPLVRLHLCNMIEIRQCTLHTGAHLAQWEKRPQFFGETG